jgi:predicted ATP-grasp superfamily ATP-dependent carboligase
LRDITVTIARLLEVWGFCEVEFIVPPGGTPLVIDVNPRICGTMRIVAMATELPIFDLPEVPNACDGAAATRFAGEIPYEGVPFASDTVVATSRLTCAAGCPRDVLGTLSAYGFDVQRETLPQVWRAD